MALTREEFEELSESFDYNDSDKDGMIEFTEFLNMLDALEAGIAPRVTVPASVRCSSI